ncbi:MAG TPA: chemotaxis protein CheD [Spirochaetota bacterium]|nr:chemotaxis protein CheD [Spirochaetota bacterium]
MYIRMRHKLGKNLTIIYPGEYYVTDRDELVGTLLGSCVAVCLHDNVKKIGAMNHFMLPGKINEREIPEDDYTRYGLASMIKIIWEMLEKGAERKNLTAKIFGGGNILSSLSSPERPSMISSDNVRMAKLMLEMEDIPIIGMDVGADFTRKIIFDVNTGRIYLRKIKGKEITKLVIERDEKLAAGRE